MYFRFFIGLRVFLRVERGFLVFSKGFGSEEGFKGYSVSEYTCCRLEVF